MLTPAFYPSLERHDAASRTDDDVIVFADHISVINLTQGKLWIGNLYMPPKSGWLKIDGGEERVRIDAAGQSGILDVQSGQVIVKGLELVNGNASLGGGMMVWDYADVTIEDSLVSGNSATNAGGGICSIGSLTMIDTVVENKYSRDIACHRVGNRPGRFEPRKRKRREKRYDGLLKPRREAKLDLLKRFTKI